MTTNRSQAEERCAAIVEGAPCNRTPIAHGKYSHAFVSDQPTASPSDQREPLEPPQVTRVRIARDEHRAKYPWCTPERGCTQEAGIVIDYIDALIAALRDTAEDDALGQALDRTAEPLGGHCAYCAAPTAAECPTCHHLPDTCQHSCCNLIAAEDERAMQSAWQAERDELSASSTLADIAIRKAFYCDGWNAALSYARSTPPDPALRETLAALCHDQWSGWMRYLFGRTLNRGGEPLSLIADYDEERWRRQMATPYAQLSEEEKESDRKEADRFLAILHARSTPQVDVQELAREIADRLWDDDALTTITDVPEIIADELSRALNTKG